MEEKYRLQVWERKGTRVLDGDRWIDQYWWVTLAIGTEAQCRSEAEYISVSFPDVRWRVISEGDYQKFA